MLKAPSSVKTQYLRLKKMSKNFFDKELFTVTSSVGTVSLFSLTMPMIFENITSTLQGMVNTVVLSFYSDTAVAAVGAVNTVVSVIILMSFVISLGATVVINNHIGAEDIKRAEEASFSLIMTGIILSLIMTPLILMFSEKIVAFLNLKGEVYSQALTYLRIRVAFMSFPFLTTCVLSLLKCYGYPKFTFVIGFLINTINLILNIYVVFFPSFSPVTGVRGVAYSCCISNAVGLIVSIYMLRRVKIKLTVPRSMGDFFSHLRRILKIGVPAGISSATLTFSRLITTPFIAQIGDYALL